MVRGAWFAVLALMAVGTAMPSENALALGRRRAARKPVPAASASVPTPAVVVAAVPEEPALPATDIRIDPRQALADIMALRQAQGMSGDTEFAGALQRLISEKHGAAPVASTEAPITPIEADAPPTADSDTVSALRASARHFDDRANAFEAARAYAEADAARQTANTLRHEARRLDP